MPPAVAAAAIIGGTTIGSAALSNRGNSRAARYQTDAANRAGELEAQSAREALAFAKEQEETRRREWQETQRKNFELHLQRRKDLEPFRRLGAGSIGQMAKPIPRMK